MRRVAATCWGKIDLRWSDPYLFTATEVAGLPRQVRGVYVLMAATPMSATLVPFYVGESSDLLRRLGEHLRSRCPVGGVLPKVLTTYVALARIDDDALRLAVESALIFRERPAGNERIATEHPAVSVNRPPTSLLD